MNDDTRSKAMSFAIVGNGKMACDILRVISDFPGAQVKICVGDPRHETAQSKLSRLCEKRNVEYRSAKNLSDPALIAYLASLKLDYIVSANNFIIFKAEHFSISRRGIINFHNGPLPRYGGLNSCSWAILNAEPTHGVTWHLVDSGIDSGPILIQRKFPVKSDITGVELMSDCIRNGVDLFSKLLPTVVAGEIETTPQDPAHRKYYGAKDRPFEGRVPWWETRDILSRFARALDFHPLPNIFFRPNIDFGDRKVFVERLVFFQREEKSTLGTVCKVADDSIQIVVDGGILQLFGLFDDKGARFDLDSLALVSLKR